MISGVVGNNDDGTASVGMELLDKIGEALAIHPARERHELHVSARTYRANQSNAEPVAAVLNLRRLANFAPGRPAMRIRPHRRLVYEVDDSANPPGLGPQSRKGPVQILLHFLRVTLIALVNRPLRAQPQMLEKTAYAALTHLYPVFLPQQPPDYAQSPQNIGKLILTWITH